MKYSLRSLMTFSIRDVALVTVIVAVALGWWLDRSRIAVERTTWKFRAEVFADELEGLGYKPHWSDSDAGISYPDGRPPFSSTPAANPPKK